MLLLLALSGVAQAQFTCTTSGTYATITGYSGAGGAVSIPSIIKVSGTNRLVTAIGDSAFASGTSLTSVTIPSGVTSIGNSAFGSCTNLTNVTIPASVTSIGNNAFWDCGNLTGLTIPYGVITIGQGAFINCTSLTTVTLPNSVSSIGDGAFGGCSSLSSVTLSSNLTSIGYQVFAFCTHLTSVPIPASVTTIGSSAFWGCTSLASVTIPTSVTTISASAFDGCTGLASVTIPNSVTSIGYAAFSSCSSLGSVMISSSVTTIAPFAFDSCANLASVTLPNSVTTIGDSAFTGCTNLTSITIPNSVTTIGPSAFAGCTSLVSVTIPNSVTSIGASAFDSCASLVSATFAGNAPSMDSSVFVGVADGFTLYLYDNGGAGFSSPPWDGYSVVTLPGPTVSTGSATAITSSSATLNATVDPNGLDTTLYFQSGTSAVYTLISGSQVLGGGASATALNTALSGLSVATVYHYQIVAINSSGTTYGLDQTFATGPTYVANGAAVSVTSVILSGTVNPNGFSGPVSDPANVAVSWQIGLVSGSYTQVTTPRPIGTGTAPVLVTGTLPMTGLTAAAYHYRLVISSTVGTTYGPDQTFAIGPTYTVDNPVVALTSVTLSGTVNPNKFAGPYTDRANEYVSWQIGPAAGNYNLATTAKAIGTGTNPVQCTTTKSGLAAAVYHCRMAISCTLGIIYSPDQVFSIQPPTVVYSAQVLTGSDVALSATVNPNLLDTTVSFQFGISGTYGSTTTPQPIGSGSAAVAVSGSFTGLAPNTFYHYRIVTTNALGTIYGLDQSFTTQPLFGTAAVVSLKDAAPGIPGATFSSLSNPALNDSDHLAFQAVVTGSAGSGVGAANNSGIWADSGSSGRILIARTGTSAPGYISGSAVGTFATLSDPVFANDDAVAFLGTLVKGGTGAGAVTAANNTGIWTTTSGSLALAARTGDRAPDASGTVSVSSPVFASFSQFVLPNQGGAVILANLVSGTPAAPAPGGIVATNSQGIWAVDTAGVLKQILRKGDGLTVGGHAKIISTLGIFTPPTSATGQTRHFNNPGDLLYKVTFTDGSMSFVQSVFP